MEYQVTLGPLAQQDLFAIHEYISRDDLGVADRFCTELLDCAESLSTFPERGRKEKNGPTRLIVHGNYLIYYDIDPNTKEVHILRFWHGAWDQKKLRLS